MAALLGTLCVSGAQDDRYHTGGRIIAKLGQDFPTARLMGQVKVKNQQVGYLARESLKEAGSIGVAQDLIAFFYQQNLDHRTDGGVVVNDGNEWLGMNR